MANKEFFITIKYDKVITELVAIRRKVNELLEYIEMQDAELRVQLSTASLDKPNYLNERKGRK